MAGSVRKYFGTSEQSRIGGVRVIWLSSFLSIWLLAQTNDSAAAACIGRDKECTKADDTCCNVQDKCKQSSGGKRYCKKYCAPLGDYCGTAQDDPCCGTMSCVYTDPSVRRRFCASCLPKDSECNVNPQKCCTNNKCLKQSNNKFKCIDCAGLDESCSASRACCPGGSCIEWPADSKQFKCYDNTSPVYCAEAGTPCGKSTLYRNPCCTGVGLECVTQNNKDYMCLEKKSCAAVGQSCPGSTICCRGGMCISNKCEKCIDIGQPCAGLSDNKCCGPLLCRIAPGKTTYTCINCEPGGALGDCKRGVQNPNSVDIAYPTGGSKCCYLTCQRNANAATGASCSTCINNYDQNHICFVNNDCCASDDLKFGLRGICTKGKCDYNYAARPCNKEGEGCGTSELAAQCCGNLVCVRSKSCKAGDNFCCQKPRTSCIERRSACSKKGDTKCCDGLICKQYKGNLACLEKNEIPNCGRPGDRAHAYCYHCCGGCRTEGCPKVSLGYLVCPGGSFTEYCTCSQPGQFCYSNDNCCGKKDCYDQICQ